jgi:L-lactate utilization protein LutC
MSDEQVNKDKTTEPTKDVVKNNKILEDNLTTNEFDKLEEEFKKELDATFQSKYDDVKKQLMDNMKEVIEKTKKESDEKYLSLLEENKQRQEQLITELKSKFADIQKEISSKNSYVPTGNNPYRQGKEESKNNNLKDFFSDPNVSSQEKYEAFRKNFLKK